MSRPLSLISTVGTALLALIISAAPAQAQNLFWNAPNGGTGTWDPTTVNWSTSAAGPVNTNWNDNSGSIVANFGNTAGTVTIAGTPSPNVGGLTFTTTGYVITGNPLVLGPGSTTVTINTGANDATINSLIGGSFAVTMVKTGTGTLTLGVANNNYDGPTQINGGVIAISTNNGLGGTFGNTTVASGAALQVSGAINSPEALVLNGTGIGGAGALRKTGTDTTRMSGNITLNSATRINSDAGTLRLTGVIDGAGIALTFGGAGNVLIDNATNRINTGNGAIIKDGAGTLTIATSNGWTGPLTINGGMVVIPLSGALGTTGQITLNGGTIRNTNTGTAGSSFVSNTRGITIGAGGGTLDVSDTTDPNTFLIYAGTIAQGANTLTKTGPAILALSGTTTGTGPILINQGTIRIRTSNERISNSSAVIVASGATLDLAGFQETVGSIVGAGNVTLGTNGRLISGGDGTSTTFSGVISGGGTTGGITKAGAGTLTLSGANAYTGTTVVNAGTLQAGAANTLPSGSAVTVAAAGTLNLDNFSQTIGSLAGAGIVSLGSGTPLGTLTTGGDNSSTTFSGVLGGIGNLTKVGTGTMILSGNNTYDGTTTVNAGTLLVNGQASPNSGTGLSSIAVNSGATFGGTGRTNAISFNVNTGATIRGGDAAGTGTLTVNGLLTLANDAIVGLRVNDATPTVSTGTAGSSTEGTVPNPTSNNFIDVTNGGLNANPAALLFTVDGTGTPFEYFQTYSYQIGRVAGQDLSAVNITDDSKFTPIGFNHPNIDFSVTGNAAGDLFVNITPVPEPATVLGLAAGAMGLGGLMRRRVVRRA